jgi:hypothetical protein
MTQQDIKAQEQQIRRGFYQELLEKIQELQDQDNLNEDLIEFIDDYKNEYIQELGITTIKQYNVGLIKLIIQFLLENIKLPPNSSFIDKFIKTLTPKDSQNLPETSNMNYEQRMLYKLRKYLVENTPKYLQMADNTQRKNTLKKEIEKLFQDDNPFAIIFDDIYSIPFNEIMTFLNKCTSFSPEETSLYFISLINQFVRNHRFDIIKELFMNGFEPRTQEDWKDILPLKYYNNLMGIGVDYNKTRNDILSEHTEASITYTRCVKNTTQNYNCNIKFSYKVNDSVFNQELMLTRKNKINKTDRLIIRYNPSDPNDYKIEERKGAINPDIIIFGDDIKQINPSYTGVVDAIISNIQ